MLSFLTPIRLYIGGAIAIMFVVMVLACSHYKNALECAKIEHQTHLIADKAAIAAQVAIQTDLAEKARAAIALSEVVTQNQQKVALQGKSLNEVKNKLGRSYEIKLTKLSMGTDTNGVLQPANSGSSASTETASTTEGFARCEQVDWSTCAGLHDEKEQLEQALALETVDFNKCRSVLDADTLMYGREVDTPASK